jgi:hypothetical protein
MQFAKLAGASAFILVLSTASFADSVKPAPVVVKAAERCASLAAQFDEAAEAHKNDKKFPAAQKLRDEGGRLCEGKHYAAGGRRIVEALKQIGVKAKI